MVCKKCGNELEGNLAFCNKCGAKVKQNNKCNYYDEIIDIENIIPEDININMLLSRSENEETISLESVVGHQLKMYGYEAKDAYYVICAFDEKYPNDFIKFKEIEKKYTKIYSELRNTTSEDEYESKRRTIEICEKIELHNITLLMLRKIEENWKSLIKLADNLIKNRKIRNNEIENEKMDRNNRILNIIIIGGIILIGVMFLINNYIGKTNSGSGDIESIQSLAIKTSILMLLILAVSIGVYLIPTFVACKKKHPYTVGIVLIDIFLGWSLIGWVGALVWACCVPNQKQSVVVREVNQTNRYDDIKKLQELKESGAITEDEFNFEKAKILNK